MIYINYNRGKIDSFYLNIRLKSYEDDNFFYYY